MNAAFIKVSCKDHENISSKTLLATARCSSSDNVLKNARNFRRSFLGGEPRSTELLSSSDNCESHSSKISSPRSRSPLIFIAFYKAITNKHGPSIKENFGALRKSAAGQKDCT